MESTVGAPRLDVWGAVLGGLFTKVNDTVQQAADQMKNAGMELEIEAGQEISRAIEQVKNAYKDQLDYTVDKISKEAKKAFDALDSAVQKFQSGLANSVTEAMTDAQQIANTLPFSSKQSQLKGVKPRCLVIDDVNSAAVVIFQGNFPNSSVKGFEPTLQMSGINCPVIDTNTQALTFRVPLSAFASTTPNRFTYKTGKLSVPWDDGYIWSHKVDSHFQVGLGALPASAGVAVVEYVASTTKHDIQHVTKSYSFNGNQFYPEHWHTCYQEIYPTPGWKIDASKPPQMISHPQHGKHNEAIESYTPDKIVLKVNLYCKDGHDIGIVNIDVAFDQYCDTPAQEKRSETIPMNWKDSKLLQPQANEVISKVAFDDYKGTHQEYGAPTLSDDVLQVEAEGNGAWKIWAQRPSSLNLAKSDLSTKLQQNIQLSQQLQSLLTLANLPKDIQLQAKQS